MPVALTGSLFDQLMALQQGLGNDLSQVDYEEQARRRLYNTDLTNLMANRGTAIKTGQTGLANRGLGQSGIALQKQTDINQGYDTQGAGMNQGYESDLASLARRRLEAQADFNLKKANLERQATLTQKV